MNPMRVARLSCRVIEQTWCRAETMGDIHHLEMAALSKSSRLQAIMLSGEFAIRTARWIERMELC
jgi:hypothetical protein